MSKKAMQQEADHEFKNFHRTLCERFGYTHDERDWKRDQVSLIEWIAKKVEQPAPAQKPVAWMYEWGGRTNFTTTDQRFVEAAHPHFVKSTPLYTAPPQRPWVGLTDEEILGVWQKAMVEDNGKHARLDNQPFVHFAKAMEAKLKDRNT